MSNTLLFDPDCRLCPRLDALLREVKQQHPHYHARPVAPFGDSDARLLIVGLAPGMHGANASGRPFTGDYAGLMLYQTLFDFGFSNQPTSESLSDGLILSHCRITNAVKCLPPRNKPSTAEIKQCNTYLASELAGLTAHSVILALGAIAHQAVLRALELKASHAAFAHHAVHALPNDLTLVDCYHTSRYNVQTKRLDQAMFSAIFVTITQLLQTHDLCST